MLRAPSALHSVRAAAQTRGRRGLGSPLGRLAALRTMEHGRRRGRGRQAAVHVSRVRLGYGRLHASGAPRCARGDALPYRTSRVGWRPVSLRIDRRGGKARVTGGPRSAARGAEASTALPFEDTAVRLCAEDEARVALASYVSDGAAAFANSRFARASASSIMPSLHCAGHARLLEGGQASEVFALREAATRAPSARRSPSAQSRRARCARRRRRAARRSHPTMGSSGAVRASRRAGRYDRPRVARVVLAACAPLARAS